MKNRINATPSPTFSLVIVIMLMVLAALAPTAAIAQPAQGSPSVPLSGPTELDAAALEPGGCGWDPYWSVARPPVLEADYESTLAVDPVDPHRMTAVWLEDDGLLVGSASTLDGGDTWSREAVPQVTTCSGGIHRTSYDTRVAIGPSAIGASRAYVVSTSQNQPLDFGAPDPRGAVMHIGLSTKALDGSAWGAPVIIEQAGPIDFPVVAADPVRPDTAYVIWAKRLTDSTYFSSTRDGGKTWSSPSLVRVTPPGLFALNEITVLADGTLLNAYKELSLTDESINNLYLARSEDEGRTWSAPELLSDNARDGGFNVTEQGGRVFATWVERSSDHLQVVVAHKEATGWVNIGRFFGGEIYEDYPLPEVAVMPDGTIGVVHYEVGELIDGTDRRRTTLVVDHSHDAGSTWTSTQIGESFDPETWLSDHGSMEATVCGFATTWTSGPDVSPHGMSDIFFSTVRVAGSPQGPCQSAPR